MPLPARAEIQATDSDIRNSLRTYCARLLTIQDKATKTRVPFVWWRAQEEVHAALERQLDAVGWVRAIILKARQLGISQYVSARFLYKTTCNPGHGQRCYILTHEIAATQELFSRAKSMYEGLPLAWRPETRNNSAKEMNFAGLESGYRVGTALNIHGTGRSQTNSLFHGCLAPDTFIVDEGGGLRRMDEFRLGDLVRTHMGALAPISAISRQRKSAHLVTLKGLGQMPLIATGEHKFLTDDGWRELNDLTPGDKLLFPMRAITDQVDSWAFRLPDSVRPQGGGTRETGPDNIDLTYKLGRILGLYLAEGTIKRRVQDGEHMAVVFSVHEREVERTIEWLQPLRKYWRSDPAIAPRPKSRTVTITVHSRSFAALVLSCCGKLSGKHLPDEWWRQGRDFVRGLVHGYLAGDGHSSKRKYDRRISAPSICSALSVGMRDALAALGYGWASIGYHPGRSRYGKICRPIWTLRLSGQGVDWLCDELGWEMPPRQRLGAYGDTEVRDGYARVPILDIERAGEIEVMDFEIDHEDHSYCTVHAATHNSEVALWPHAEQHFTASVQSIADVRGTEIILESTANGIGNTFHQYWTQAVDGVNGYVPIFIPWYWAPDYRRNVVHKGYEPGAEEEEYARLFDLTDSQLAWMYYKNLSLGGEPGKLGWKFRQEYPATPDEAFQTSGDSLISPLKILRARKAVLPEDEHAPRVLGVDSSLSLKGDETFAIDRQGWNAGELVYERIETDDQMAIAERIAFLIEYFDFHRVFVDFMPGKGVVDILRRMGYKKVVRAVHFSHKPTEEEKYITKRGEIWGRLKDWLEGSEPVSIPDSDRLQQHLCAPVWGVTATRLDEKGRLRLELKEKIKDRTGFSPDEADALALTFTETVVVPINPKPSWRDELEQNVRATGFMAS